MLSAKHADGDNVESDGDGEVGGAKSNKAGEEAAWGPEGDHLQVTLRYPATRKHSNRKLRSSSILPVIHGHKATQRSLLRHIQQAKDITAGIKTRGRMIGKLL